MSAAPARRGSGAPSPSDSHESGLRPATKTAPSRVADHIVDALEQAGVDTIYGIPGGAIAPMYDALVGRTGIRVVSVRHETNAAFMAIGHARLLPGALPCVFVTSGPGVTNLVTGLAAARAEGVPMLVLAGEAARSRFGKNALQEGSPQALDVISIVRSVTRHATMLALPGHAASQVAACARLARETRGPVFLSIPLDVALAPGTRAALGPCRPAPRELDPCAVASAAALLRSAERPLVLLGSGARAAADRVRRFVSRFGFAVITSPRAKGVVSESSRSCLGVFGYGGHPSVDAWLDERPPDVTLALGCGLSETSTNGFSPRLQPTRALVQVDLDASAFGRNYDVEVAILGDCGDVLDALENALSDLPVRALSSTGILRHETGADGEGDAPLSPSAVVAALTDVFPPDTVYTTDIGEHTLFAIHHVRTTRPDGFIAALGLGSMGSGIGAALGAKLAAPRRAVVAICGDYGFQMYGMELATAVQEGLDVVFVVMNDARMRMVEAGTLRNFGRGLPADGPIIDFAAIARAQGAFGVIVRTRRELALAALARSRTGPTLLDVRIDRAASFPVNARVLHLGSFNAPGGAR